MMSSEVQLTEAATVSASHGDSGSVGEAEGVLISGDNQAEDDSIVSSLSEVTPVMEDVADVAAAPEEEDKPTADDDKVESSSHSKTNDDGQQSSMPDKADSDISEQCSQMVSTKSRGGRSYQESRRSKKTVGEKSKSASQHERSHEVLDSHGLDAGCLEQKGKGDVRDAGMSEEDSLRQMKELVCHPTCDGDPPALVNVILDEHDMRKRYALVTVNI